MSIKFEKVAVMIHLLETSIGSQKYLYILPIRYRRQSAFSSYVRYLSTLSRLPFRTYDDVEKPEKILAIYVCILLVRGSLKKPLKVMETSEDLEDLDYFDECSKLGVRSIFHRHVELTQKTASLA